MSRAAQIAAEANARVSGWPSMSAEARRVPPADVAAQVRPLPSGAAMLSLYGVDRPFGSVFDALAEADAQGIPRDRVRVLRFEPTPIGS